MTQEAVADVIGIERSYLARVERGKGPPFKPERIDRLATLFSVDAGELRALARTSQTLYRLAGVDVTGPHRDLGALLEVRWPDLDEEPLREMLALIEGAPEVAVVGEQTEFGRYIQAKRLEQKPPCSQQSVADAIGLARSFISMVELGHEPPFTPPKLRSLAKFFRVPLAELTQRAARSKPYYRLDGVGDRVTDAHRELGAELQRRWLSLPREALVKLRAVGL